jgi:hypothetical protein
MFMTALQVYIVHTLLILSICYSIRIGGILLLCPVNVYQK